jgi:hypothetical protein
MITIGCRKPARAKPDMKGSFHAAVDARNLTERCGRHKAIISQAFRDVIEDRLVGYPA